MEYGEPHVDVREPRPWPLRIPGAPAKALRRSPFVRGEWHLWIYCCEWSLLLDDIQLAHNESSNVTMYRALRVLDGQVLQAVDIEPADGRTRFTFDLGCSLLTYPAPPGVFDDPAKQWMLYSYSDAGLVVLSVYGDGTYCITDGAVKRGDEQRLPLGAPSPG